MGRSLPLQNIVRCSRCVQSPKWRRAMCDTFGRPIMKTLVIAAALAAVVASPALAQTAQRRATPQQMYQSQYDQTVGHTGQPCSINAQPVYDNNQYLGADPDPNVRLDLRRDYEGRDF